MPKIKNTNPAVIEGRTLFVNSVKPPNDNMLKPGYNNNKLGFKITKGKWKDYPIFSLTLEERKTCPRYCKHWVDCYSNNMYLAIRYDHTHKDFYTKLESNIKELANKYNKGFVLRLHVLGDFFSVKYIHFWRRMLNRYPSLNIYGYTAYKVGSRYTAINGLNNDFSDRFVVRFSGTNFDLSTDSANDLSKTGVQCPEQTAKVDSCAKCTLCWNKNIKQVLFITH